jgi:hypothetical protein
MTTSRLSQHNNSIATITTLRTEAPFRDEVYVMHMQMDQPNYIANPASKMSKRPKGLLAEYLGQPLKAVAMPQKLEPLNFNKVDVEERRAASGLTYPDISLQY